MEPFLIPAKDTYALFGYDPEKDEKKARGYLWDHGVKQFRKGFYAKAVIYDFLKKESEKCISGKEENTTTSRVKYVWANKPLKLKNTARALLASKMQESMQTEQLAT